MRLVHTAVLVLLLSFTLQPALAGDQNSGPSQWVKTTAVGWVKSIGWDKKVGCIASVLAAATTYSYTSTLLHTVTTLKDPTVAGFAVAGAASGLVISWKAVRKLMGGQNPIARTERVDGAGIILGSFIGSWLTYSLVDASFWGPMVGGVAGLGAGWKAAVPLDRRLQDYLRDTPALDVCIARLFADPKQATALDTTSAEIPDTFAQPIQKLTGKQVPFWIVRTAATTDGTAEYHLLIAEKMHGVRMLLVFSDTLRPAAIADSNNAEVVIWRSLVDLQKI
jgi:hypothetical protein